MEDINVPKPHIPTTSIISGYDHNTVPTHFIYSYHFYTIPTRTEPTESRSTWPRWKTKTGRSQPSLPEQSLCHLQQRQPPSEGLSIAIPLTNGRAPCLGGTYKSRTSVAKCRGVGKLLGNLLSSARLTGCPKKNGSIAPSLRLNSSSLSRDSFLLSLTSAAIAKHT